MKKTRSLKHFSSNPQQDIIHLQSSTEHTELSETQNSNHNDFSIKSNHYQTQSIHDHLKFIQRTSSVSLFKQKSTNVNFQFFGSPLLLDSSDKQQAQQTLNQWIRELEIDFFKKIQIKMIVYSELSKRNMEFNHLLEKALSEYADMRMNQIQEQEFKKYD